MQLCKNCKNCGVSLTEQNTYPQYLRICYYLCKDCARKRGREYYKERAKDPTYLKKKNEYIKTWLKAHPEYKEKYKQKKRESFKNWRLKNRIYHNDYIRRFAREKVLYINGKRLLIKKRLRPNNCELCDEPKRMLYYHHWNDNKPSWGVWVCIGCHYIVEVLDRHPSAEIKEKYFRLKSQIEKLEV